jgi:sodium transport system permease protein
MNAMLAVFLKEVKENLRDKRTVMSALLYGPLLGPVMFVMLINVLISRDMTKAEAPLEVPVIGIEHAPNLVSMLKQQGLVPKPPLADPGKAVTDRDADVVLSIPAGFGKAWDKGMPAQVDLIFDASRHDTQSTVKRLKHMLEGWGRQQAAMRLAARGLSPGLATPLVISERDQSTPASRSTMLFGMLPYFFVLAVFIGGMYLAIDLTAGERERQSLEPLFASPLARWRILVGKLAAIAAFSFASLVICAVTFSVAGNFMPTEKLGIAFDLGPGFIGEVLLLMLPLLAVFAVLQTLVAAFAKSFREAQTYLSILMIVPLLPTMLLTFMPVKTADWMYTVPLLAQQIGITELLRGEAVSVTQIGLALGSGFALALVIGLITARIYRSERLAISA